MKRLTTLAIVMMSLLVASPAFAFFSFNHYDFGSTPFDHNNNTAPISYPYGVGYHPSPGNYGEGGEKFDLEGLHVALDDDYLYVAITNSFGTSVTSSAWGSTFDQGDIFFGSAGNKNVMAIDISSGNLVHVNSWGFIDNVPGSYYSNSTIRNRVGAFKVLDGTTLGDASQMMTFYENLETDPLTPDPTNGNTYVFEWKISRSALEWDGSSNLFFHTTLGCGNDLMEYDFSVIPEPATMILLGLGLFGVGVFARRKIN